uniref:Uncharacterized protein n=1 Tax=Megaselia scalaris TaxID=36166 RepID=T1GRA9_MEGSC
MDDNAASVNKKSARQKHFGLYESSWWNLQQFQDYKRFSTYNYFNIPLAMIMRVTNSSISNMLKGNNQSDPGRQK